MKQTIDISDGNGPAAVLAKLGKFGLLPFLGIFLVVAGILTSVYQVPLDSEAVILRFGKYRTTTPSGLHFKAPFFIDSKTIVPVKRQLKMEFGFGTTDATNRYQFSNRQTQNEEQSMITGDRNAALVEWVVQYRIADPKKYLFSVRNPEDTLRDASESAMREVVGDRTVDEVITIGRQDIESTAQLKLQNLVDSYGLGFSITQVQLKNVNPPRKVQPSFNKVNQAQQERESMINVAKGEYNKVVPKASGQADQQVARAEGEAQKRINEATGDAERFNAIFDEYRKSPAVTRERLYLERMQEVLPRLKSKIVVEEGSANSPVPLLHLGDSSLNPINPKR